MSTLLCMNMHRYLFEKNIGTKLIKMLIFYGIIRQKEDFQMQNSCIAYGIFTYYSKNVDFVHMGSKLFNWLS